MPVKKELILIGGGGHCRSCIDMIENEGKWKIAGIVDVKEKLNQRVLDYKVIANDDDLPKLARKYKYFLITVGCIKDPQVRIERFEHLKQLGATFPVIISRQAYVARSAQIGEGTIVMHKALINANARVGKNSIVNTAALIEHDSIVGDHCHISTGSIVNGTCRLGNRVFTGSNSVIVHEVNVADDVTIGAGAVVTKSINEAGLYVGNPLRALQFKE